MKHPGAVVVVGWRAEQIGERQQRAADLSEEASERDQLLAGEHSFRQRPVDLMEGLEDPVE
ncbi:MAG: hypothetical protein ACRDST_23640 [Pseudonocardiaceae bacterium]